MFFYLLVLLTLSFSGCATQPAPHIQYPAQKITLSYDAPNPFKLSIYPKPNLFLTTAENVGYTKSEALREATKNQFHDRTYYNVIDHMDPAQMENTYILQINTYLEGLVSKSSNTKSDTLISIISLYVPPFLEMKQAFMIHTELGNPAAQSAENKLANQIVDAMAAAMRIKKRTLDVIIPDTMDARAYQLLRQSEFFRAKSRLKSILPPIDFAKCSIPEINTRYQKWHQSGLRKLETDLLNYYVYLLIFEITEDASSKLEHVVHGYQTIFILTKNKQLSHACAHALGRLEGALGRKFALKKNTMQ